MADDADDISGMLLIIAHVARLIFFVALGVFAYGYFSPPDIRDIPVSQLTSKQIFGNLAPIAFIGWLGYWYVTGLENVGKGWGWIGIFLIAGVAAAFVVFRYSG